MYRSSGSPSKTSSASASGVPRVPPPHGARVARRRSSCRGRSRCTTNTVSASIQRRRPWPRARTKPSSTEAARVEVELARRRRRPPRRATGRPARGRQSGRSSLRAVPDPALALGRAQGVEVEHHLPLRVVGAVLLERGAPPQAALVLGVAPEVVVAGRRRFPTAGSWRRSRGPRGPPRRIASKPAAPASRSTASSLRSRTQASAALAVDVLEPGVRVVVHGLVGAGVGPGVRGHVHRRIIRRAASGGKPASARPRPGVVRRRPLPGQGDRARSVPPCPYRSLPASTGGARRPRTPRRSSRGPRRRGGCSPCRRRSPRHRWSRRCRRRRRRTRRRGRG